MSADSSETSMNTECKISNPMTDFHDAEWVNKALIFILATFSKDNDNSAFEFTLQYIDI